jgi:hypothetical protein
MIYTEFFRFLRKWRDAKRYPPSTAWPREISLDTKAWEGIQKLYNHTRMDGHEYETSFFFVEGETFLTTPMRGTTDQVTASHSLQVKYEIDQHRRVYYRNIIIDGKPMSKSAVKPSQLTKDTQIGFLFNIHSHPEHINALGQVTYSFFSDTDIRTLLGSDVIVAGLITDSFWLVAKTDKTIGTVGEVGEELLYQISEQAFAGESYLDDIIRQNMSRWGLVFYRADFRKPLIRIN